VAHVQVQFAIDDPERADAIVDALLADRLIACGQRTGPIHSSYWWQGEREEADEWLVLMKTRADLAPTVVAAVVERHPYETPEVVTLELVGGAAEYLEWIDEVTAPAGGRQGRQTPT
jgi:periplasmic divalent cation tolerance protein